MHANSRAQRRLSAACRHNPSLSHARASLPARGGLPTQRLPHTHHTFTGPYRPIRPHSQPAAHAQPHLTRTRHSCRATLPCLRAAGVSRAMLPPQLPRVCRRLGPSARRATSPAFALRLQPCLPPNPNHTSARQRRTHTRARATPHGDPRRTRARPAAPLRQQPPLVGPAPRVAIRAIQRVPLTRKPVRRAGP